MIKKKLKRYIKKNFPKFLQIYKILIQKHNDVSFEGWGMTTLSTNNPWEKNLNETTKIFNKIHLKILNDIKNKIFIDTTPGNDILDSIETLQGLKWRHYLIFNSVRLLKNKKIKKLSLNVVLVMDCLSNMFSIKHHHKTQNFICMIHGHQC